MINKLRYFKLNLAHSLLYAWGKGWIASPKTREDWRKAANALMERFNFLVVPEELQVSSASAPEGVKGVESIYIHPMEITGIMYPETFKQIQKYLHTIETITVDPILRLAAGFDTRVLRMSYDIKGKPTVFERELVNSKVITVGHWHSVEQSVKKTQEVFEFYIKQVPVTA